MKIKNLPIRIFEIGDHVITPNGFGKVINVKEEYHKVEKYFERSEVEVLHKNCWSGGPSDKKQWIEAENVILITEMEYNGDIKNYG